MIELSEMVEEVDNLGILTTEILGSVEVTVNLASWSMFSIFFG